MKYKTLAKAISDIDGGCTACIQSFLEESAEAFSAEERYKISENWDITKYPFSDVFEEGWKANDKLREIWINTKA